MSKDEGRRRNPVASCVSASQEVTKKLKLYVNISFTATVIINNKLSFWTMLAFESANRFGTDYTDWLQRNKFSLDGCAIGISNP